MTIYSPTVRHAVHNFKVLVLKCTVKYLAYSPILDAISIGFENGT